MLCDVYLNKVKYKDVKSINIKVNDFVKQICRPLKDYEVIFGVLNLRVKKYPMQVWDAIIDKLSAEDLVSMQLNWGGEVKSRILKEFVEYSVITVAMRGNNSGFIVERAREKAGFVLKALQTYLRASSGTRDENVLFEITEFSLLREKGSEKWYWNWRAKRRPFGISISDCDNPAIKKINDQFKVFSNLTTDFRSRIERAIYWVGASIQEEIFDHKLIYLCTALETLLTNKDDKRKGEVITYRMVLLNHLVEGHFPEPFQLMWFYELRSRIVHGSALGEVTDSDYSTLCYITNETLFNFISLLEKFGTKDYNNFITKFESSENLVIIENYFKKFKGKWPESILELISGKSAKQKSS